ncbi:MAG: PEGA domain-containing protein [Candidatus Eisenbacteria bacterium]
MNNVLETGLEMNGFNRTARSGRLRLSLFLVCVAEIFLLCLGCGGDGGGVEPVNRPPTVNAISLDPPRAGQADTLNASAIAGDPEGAPLTFRWTASTGTLLESASQTVRWVAPQVTALCTLRVFISDSKSEVSMERLIPVGRGTLTIESYPSGAAIYIGSQPTGLTTPVTLQDAPAGAYQISVVMQPYSYYPYASLVDLSDGETALARFWYRLDEGAMGTNQMTLSDCVTQSSWAPDGQQIVCAVESPSLGYRALSVFGWPWPDLTDDVVNTFGQANWGPSWHPANFELVFASARSGVNKIYHIAVSGYPYSGTPSLIYNEEANYPVWSPSGQRVAFVARNGASFSLMAIPSSGGPATTLADDVEEDRPAWSPDGTQIAFSKKVGDETYLFVVPSTGGVASRFSYVPGRHPDWHPDGTKIAFTSAFDGTDNVWILFLGQGPEAVPGQLTSSGGDWPAWRPDGAALALTRFNLSQDCRTLWLLWAFPF